MDDLRAGKRTRLTALRRRKNGSLCRVSAALAPVFQDGKIAAFSAISHDITESERMEEALRRNEERFQLAVRASQDVVWDWDLTQDRMWWSERFWEQFGYAPATFPPAGRVGPTWCMRTTGDRIRPLEHRHL